MVLEEERQREEGGKTVTSHQPDDATIEQLTSDLQKIQLSSPLVESNDTAMNQPDSPSDCKDGTALENDGETEFEAITELKAVKLCPVGQEKPLIEEIDVGTSSSDTCSSDSESSSSSSEEKESTDTDSSETGDSHSSDDKGEQSTD